MALDKHVLIGLNELEGIAPDPFNKNGLGRSTCLQSKLVYP